ncbi:stalk domain-containing protein [Paenibacillus baekrokdamisoli]|uniref:stalk domain-containing protein n=1 Tax=Paenibacillus baekrokdamisoli TaxID=1712516 RepID=UPI001C856CDA|nr:stalk domain-containing protein [Paenibacillus baekrokdamisoli]
MILIGAASFPGTAFSKEAANPTVQLFEDGLPINMQPRPIVDYGDVYLPARAVFSYMGYKVIWSEDKILLFEKDKKPQIGMESYSISTVNYEGDYGRSLIKNNRLYISLHYFNELTPWLGSWNQNKQTVTLHRTRLIEALSVPEMTTVEIQEAKEQQVFKEFNDSHQYAPNEYLFFSSGEDQVTFLINMPAFKYAEYTDLIRHSTVLTSASRQPVAAKLEVYESGNYIHFTLQNAPREDLVIRLQAEGLTKEFTLRYADIFTYDLNSATDPSVPIYFHNSDLDRKALKGKVQQYSIVFSDSVNRGKVEKVLHDQLGKNPHYVEWKSDKELQIRVKAQEDYKIDLTNIDRNGRHISNWWNYLIVHVKDEAAQYDIFDSRTGQFKPLFTSMAEYSSLIPSPDGNYFIGKEEVYDEESTSILTLVDRQGHATELSYMEFGWLADTSSLLYMDYSNNKLHAFDLKHHLDQVIWSPQHDQQHLSLFLVNPYKSQAIIAITEENSKKVMAVDLSNDTMGKQTELPIALFDQTHVSFIDADTLLVQSNSGTNNNGYLLDIKTGLQTKLDLQQLNMDSVIGYGWLLVYPNDGPKDRHVNSFELLNVHTGKRIKLMGHEGSVYMAVALSPDKVWMDKYNWITNNHEYFTVNLKDGSRTKQTIPENAEWVGNGDGLLYYQLREIE